jgi:hypothetical protein
MSDPTIELYVINHNDPLFDEDQDEALIGIDLTYDKYDNMVRYVKTIPEEIFPGEKA